MQLPSKQHPITIQTTCNYHLSNIRITIQTSCNYHLSNIRLPSRQHVITIWARPETRKTHSAALAKSPSVSAPGRGGRLQHFPLKMFPIRRLRELCNSLSRHAYSCLSGMYEHFYFYSGLSRCLHFLPSITALWRGLTKLMLRKLYLGNYLIPYWCKHRDS